MQASNVEATWCNNFNTGLEIDINIYFPRVGKNYVTGRQKQQFFQFLGACFPFHRTPGIALHCIRETSSHFLLGNPSEPEYKSLQSQDTSGGAEVGCLRSHLVSTVPWAWSWATRAGAWGACATPAARTAASPARPCAAAAGAAPTPAAGRKPAARRTLPLLVAGWGRGWRVSFCVNCRTVIEIHLYYGNSLLEENRFLH